MSLDIHLLPATEKRPFANSRKLAFDEEIHTAIFWGGHFQPGRFPQLTKMRDYYEDAEFSGNELSQVITEISDLLTIMPRDVRMQATMREFQDTCKAADSTAARVLCFAD